MHRYTALNYNDFWTSLLDRLLGVNPALRLKILEWDSEEFNNSINRCNNSFLEPIFKPKKVQTSPESGTSLQKPKPSNQMERQMRCFLQEDFGYNRHGTLLVNNFFEGISFIS